MEKDEKADLKPVENAKVAEKEKENKPMPNMEDEKRIPPVEQEKPKSAMADKGNTKPKLMNEAETSKKKADDGGNAEPKVFQVMPRLQKNLLKKENQEKKQKLR